MYQVQKPVDVQSPIVNTTTLFLINHTAVLGIHLSRCCAFSDADLKWQFDCSVDRRVDKETVSLFCELTCGDLNWKHEKTV